MGRVIEQLAGNGKVFSTGAQVAEVKYRITVFQKTVSTGRGQEIDGLEEVTGTIGEISGMSLFEMIDQDDLVLHLSDGRRWEFGVSNLEGDAINRGADGIY